MTSALDIYRSANELIKQFGDAADIEAAMRADERLAAGDMEGESTSALPPKADLFQHWHLRLLMAHFGSSEPVFAFLAMVQEVVDPF